ncbi:MAG: type II secretion system protein J [Planctomycetota bacterium]
MNKQQPGGFTLIELTISAALMSLLAAVALNIGMESTRMVAFADADTQVQAEANRGFRRISEVLRKTGWNTEPLTATTYPEIPAGNTELRMRMLADLDGNGFPFDEDTGDLEWDNTVFSVRFDAVNQTVAIYDPFGNQVMLIARHVTAFSASTYLQDPTLNFNEIRLLVQVQQNGPRGELLSYTASGSVHMRN